MDLEQNINIEKQELYVIATKDIKRFGFSSDAHPADHVYCFADEYGESIPEYIVFQATDNGLVEFFTRLPIESEEDKELGHGVYYTLEDDATLYKIFSLDELYKCYNGQFEKDFLFKLGKTYLEFYKKGTEAKAHFNKKNKEISKKRFS